MTAEEAQGAPIQTLELKICERCGGLWLRPAKSGWIYCGECKKQMDGVPRRGLRSKKAAEKEAA